MLQTISTTYRSWAFRVTIWLLLAGIMAGLTFMVWVASAVKPTKTQAFKRDENPDKIDPLILLTNQRPAEMQNLVQPIKFDAVIRDLRNYPKEFKDLKFIKENQDKWTLQVMNVVEHDVITDYLNNREGDRAQFNYVRIVDKQGQKRYVLTYGTFANTEQAFNTGRAIDFNLPPSVSVFPARFKTYEEVMDEYEITPPVQDLSAKRDVKLSGVPKEAPVKPQKPKTEEPKKNKSADSIEKSTDSQKTLSIKENKTLLDEQKHAQDRKQNQDNVRNNTSRAQETNNQRAKVNDENKQQQLKNNQNSSNINRQEAQKKSEIDTSEKQLKPTKVEQAPPLPDTKPRQTDNNRQEKPTNINRESNSNKETKVREKPVEHNIPENDR